MGSANNYDDGDQSYLEKLHQIIPTDKKDIVTFVGFITNDNLPGIYSIADCGLLGTKISETVTLFLLEIMACGIPVVAPSIGGLPEVIREGKEGILISEDYSQVELVEAMYQMVINKSTWQRKSVEIAKYINDKFNWARVAHDLTRIVNEVG